MKKLICPWCNGEVHIVICDEEGNLKPEEYKEDPWSGLCYALVHNKQDVPNNKICPIAINNMFNDAFIGDILYDSIDEACEIWENHQKNEGKII